MGFQVVAQRYKKKALSGAPPITTLYPVYGHSTKRLADQALVYELALQNRGPNLSRVTMGFLISTGPNEFMWYCYPSSYGEGTFLDVASNFTGGWDGAHDDIFSIWGPSTINVLVNGSTVPFFCYRSDWDNLGLNYQWNCT